VFYVCVSLLTNLFHAFYVRNYIILLTSFYIVHFALTCFSIFYNMFTCLFQPTLILCILSYFTLFIVYLFIMFVFICCVALSYLLIMFYHIYILCFILFLILYLLFAILYHVILS